MRCMSSKRSPLPLQASDRMRSLRRASANAECDAAVVVLLPEDAATCHNTMSRVNARHYMSHPDCMPVMCCSGVLFATTCSTERVKSKWIVCPYPSGIGLGTRGTNAL